jgi:hypothetical protein
VTYNYDRLLEYRLTGALAAHYGRPEAECIAALKAIPIIHLHGDLGLLPGFGAADAETVPFGPVLGDSAIFSANVDRAAKRVIVVHEANGDTEEYARALAALEKTDQVVLLGFGYGATNLSRLQPARWKRDIAVTGTLYGLTPSRIIYDVRAPFEAAGFSNNPGTRGRDADPKHGVREFLENRLDIFRS